MICPICDRCGQLATCLGAYEGTEIPDYACDNCCGHGNEDGWCRPISRYDLWRLHTNDPPGPDPNERDNRANELEATQDARATKENSLGTESVCESECTSLSGVPEEKPNTHTLTHSERTCTVRTPEAP